MGKFVHECQLKLESEHDTIASAIKKRQFYAYIRRKLFLISSNENHRKIIRLSAYGVEKERIRHLQSHPYIIHPFSLFRFYWEVIMIIIFLVRIFGLSYYILQKQELHLLNAIRSFMTFVVHTAFFLDFHLNFVTGIFDNSKFEFILDPKIYIKRYIFSGALLDFLSCTPLEHIHGFRHEKTISTSTVFSFCRFLYVFRFVDYLNRLRQKREYAIHKFKILQTISMYLLIFSYAISFIGVAKMIDNHISFDKLDYKSCVSAAVNMIFGTAQFPVICNWTELLVHVVGRIIGISLGITFIAQVVTYILCRYNSKIKFNTQIKELEEYMLSKELPEKLKHKILTYQSWYYEQKLFKDDEIWTLISKDMKCNALYDILKPHLLRGIFSVCTQEVHLILVSYMRKHLYLPGDILFEANTFNKSLFIIHNGSVQLRTADNYRVAVLNEGKIFVDIIPEYAELYETQRRYNIIAREYVIVYKLKLKDLFETLMEYPAIQKHITQELKRKTNLILKSPKHFLNLNEYYKTDSPQP